MTPYCVMASTVDPKMWVELTPRVYGLARRPSGHLSTVCIMVLNTFGKLLLHYCINWFENYLL